MRLFQNSGLYPSYVPRLRQLTSGKHQFGDLIATFLNDRFGAPHILSPVLDGDPDAFFTNGDDENLQYAWAKQKGMSGSSSLEDILLAQIEDHRAEVFYNLDPITYGTEFLKRIPGSVRKSLAWRAAPLHGADLSGYDLVVSNFPGILEGWSRIGINTAVLFPAHDPVLDGYAGGERSIDVLFVGGYSRYHTRRAKVLEAVASLSSEFEVRYHLDNSRFTKLADSVLGLLPPLAKHRRPGVIRRIAQAPIFGRELYKQLGSAKIVVNAAIDMAGPERGNMRCFEAMGSGAVLASDAGVYPPGFTPDETMIQYASPEEAVLSIRKTLADPVRLSDLVRRGREVVSSKYSKSMQWKAFERLSS